MPLTRRGLFSFGPFVLNAETSTLRRGDELIPLPPKVFDTLLALVSGSGEVLSKEDLLKSVWPDSFVEESNLTQNVFTLRRALGQSVDGPAYIQTVPKRGYRIAVPVMDLTAVDIQNAGRFTSSAAGRLPAWIKPLLLGAALVLFILGIAVALSPVHSGVTVSKQFHQLTRDMAAKTGTSGSVGGPGAALATDGTRVYFTEGTQGSLSVWQVSVNGGEAIKIPLPLPSAEVLDFSRVRSELLVGETVDAAGDGKLWAVAVPTGRRRRVGEIVARNASWSHDGRRIAFVRGRDVYLFDENGFDEKKLAELPGLGWRPRWSPDDSLLRLTVADAQQMTQSLWEVALDTGKARPLLPDWNQPHAECCGEWSDDGTYFFQATRGEDTQIWALPSRSRLFQNLHLTPVQVTSGQMDSLSPLPQPNRNRIFVIGEQKRGELVHYDPRSHQFVRYLDGLSADFVEFSRDGKWIAYVLMPEGTLWRSRADGTDRLQLSFAPEEARAPQWSPDSKRIVFHSMAPGRHHQDRIVSRDGGIADPIPGTLDGAMHPTWSPGGNELLYSDYPFFGGAPSQIAVHILDLATRKVTTLPGSKGFFSPSWSPDGLYAAALAIEKQSVMLFDFGKQSWTEIAEGWGIPHWSNDSKYLYFLRYSPRRQICRVAVPNGSIEEVADISEIREAGSLAGLQFSLAPDNEPVLLRNIGMEEIYAADLNRR